LAKSNPWLSSGCNLVFGFTELGIDFLNSICYTEVVVFERGQHF